VVWDRNVGMASPVKRGGSKKTRFVTKVTHIN
jgi:hypothetical protein